MTSQVDDKNRDMVPRWRAATAFAVTDEKAPIRPQPSPSWLDDLSELETKRFAWERQPSCSQAVELVGTAILYRRPDVGTDAAEYLLESNVEAHRHLASKLLEWDKPNVAGLSLTESTLITTEEIHTNIRELRKSLREEPRNPFGWTDLARAHASAGNREAAERAMKTALGLSPNNRIILRSASRLYVHLGKRQKPKHSGSDLLAQAHSLITKADNVRVDPWLLAAELGAAQAAGRTSRLTGRARRLVIDESIQPIHRTELAGVLATLHLRSGSIQQARKMFRLSLIDPTDNSLAQAQWATNRGVEDLSELPERVGIQRGYEARARRALALGQWDDTVRECRSWFNDEPFAPDPAAYGSYAASVGTMNFEDGIAFARAGLRANPSHQLLRNNLVFALIHNGELEQAETEFHRIGRPDEEMTTTLLATKGLLNYRRGNHNVGRALYLEAINTLLQATSISQETNRRTLSLASLLFAYEELLSGAPLGARDVREALDRVRRYPLPEAMNWLNRMENVIHNSPGDLQYRSTR